MAKSSRDGSTLIPALLGLLLISILYRCYVWPRVLSPYRRLPGPAVSAGQTWRDVTEMLLQDTWQPWGHIAALFSNPPGQKILKWMRINPNDGLLVFRFFGRHQLIPTSAATLKAVLNDHAYDWQKPPKMGEFLGSIIGYGVVLSEGDAHRHQRRQLLPAFHVSVIRKLYPLFWQKGRQLVERLEGSGSEICANFHEWAASVTLDIIGVAGFAHDFNSLGGQNSELIESYKRLLEPCPSNLAWFALVKVFPVWLVKLLMPGKNREFHNDMHRLRQQARELVQKRRTRPEGVDVLSQIIADRSMSDENTVDQVLTMLAAGHETTAAAFCWVVYLLTLHLETQRTLRNEIRQKIDSIDVAINHHQVETLPLLKAVCNETLRLYPIAPILVREAVRDTMLADQSVRKGTTVILVPWAINRSEQFWDEPDAFRPERWMDERGMPSNYASLTFLQGPRRCLGADFALAELKCLVATLVGRFDIRLDMDKDEVRPAGFFTLKPKHGLRIRLTALPGW